MSLDKEMFHLQERLLFYLNTLYVEIPKNLDLIKEAVNQRQILDYKNNLVGFEEWLETCSGRIKTLQTYCEARSIGSEIISFGFNDDTGEKLIEMAKKQNTTVDDVVAQALFSYIKKERENGR